jgi:F420-non-reducing hydrogenase iron-sulfur subunit
MEKRGTDHFIPRIVGFLCKWCSYAGADLAGTSRLKMPPYMIPIRVMCSSRVDPLSVLHSYLEGLDGILIAGCHPGDCHYQQGNYFTRRRFVLLKGMFDTLGLETERVQLSWISAAEGKRFKEVVEDFGERVKSMGPNPSRKEVFL